MSTGTGKCKCSAQERTGCSGTLETERLCCFATQTQTGNHSARGAENLSPPQSTTSTSTDGISATVQKDSTHNSAKADSKPSRINNTSGGIRLSGIRRTALVGMLCAAAIVGRIALSALPNIQPVTAILILIAVYIGLWDAAIASAVVVTVTNLYLGFGIWSLYQMAVWAVIAIVGGLLFRRSPRPLPMLIYALAAGYVFGALVSVFSWRTMTGVVFAGGYVAYWLAGLLYDTYHAVANAVFIWFLIPLFERFRSGLRM